MEVCNVAKIRLTWKDNRLSEDGVRIYRSTTPIDPEALPAPLASVPVGQEVYEDKTVTAETTYHYYVAPFDGPEIGAGSASSVVATEDVPRFLYATQQISLGYDNDGQTLTIRVPDCRAGDLLVLFGLRRSAFTSTPADWAVGPTPANAQNASIPQWTFALWKIADGSEPGTILTLQQTNNVRMSATIAVIRHDSRPINVTPLGTARFDGVPDAQPYSFTNIDKPALVMSILSWTFQTTSGSSNFIWNNTRMIPVFRPTVVPINEPTTRQYRSFAFFVKAAANEVFNSGVMDFGTDNETDSRSDIHLAFWV